MDNRIKYGIVAVVVIAVVAWLATRPLTEPQKELVAFEAKCKTQPNTEECKKWAESKKDAGGAD